MELDINRKLQDKANTLVNEALTRCPQYKSIPELDNFLKNLIALSMNKGFIWGVSSIKQTADLMLKDMKGEL